MHTKNIIFFGTQVILACDGNCNKAWGIQCRPKVQLDPTDPDDYAMLADSELGDAPANPGTYEGDHAKPTDPSGSNKWCARQCERSDLFDPGEPIKLPDFSKRLFNKPQSARCWSAGGRRAGAVAWCALAIVAALGRDGQPTNGID